MVPGRNAPAAVLLLAVLAVLPGMGTAGPPVKEADEEPLPRGALVRMGTTRFRTTAPILGLSFSADGKTLAAGCADGLVQVWDAASGSGLRRLSRPGNAFATVSFRQDGESLAAAGPGYFLALWNLGDRPADRDQPRTFDTSRYNVTCSVLSPDGRFLAAAAHWNVWLWKVSTGERTHHFRLPQRATALWFTDGGKSLAALCSDWQVRVLAVDTGAELRRFRCAEQDQEAVDLAVPAPDTPLLATACKNAVVFWETDTGRRAGSVRLPGGDVTALGFSADAKLLAAANDRSIHLIDPVTQRTVRPLSPSAHWYVTRLVFAPDGKRLAAAGSLERNVVRVWETATGKELPSSADTGHKDAVWRILFAPDGKAIVSTNFWGPVVRVWDPKTGKEVRQLPGVNAVGFVPGGRQLLLWSDRDFPATQQLWDVASGKPGRSFPGRYAAVTPDGRLLGVDEDETVVLLDPATGREQRRSDWREFQLGPTVGFSPDGRQLAVALTRRVVVIGGGREAEEVEVWDVASGRVRWRVDGETFAFRPDGRSLVVTSPERVGLWDADGRPLWGREMGTGPGLASVRLVSVSPDGRLIAAVPRGDRERGLVLWELYSGWPLPPLEGHRGQVCAAAFAPDGRTVATGSADTTVLAWDLLACTGRAVPPRRLTDTERDQAWAALERPNPRRAYAAIGTLAADPSATVAFLRSRLKVSAPPDARRLDRVLAELDHREFTVRERASKELREMGKAAGPALRKALRGEVSAEVRRRVTVVLDELERNPLGVGGPGLQQLRAIQALEQIGTTEARDLLRSLDDGWDESFLTIEARAALRRLRAP